jgi:hypothetical protein
MNSKLKSFETDQNPTARLPYWVAAKVLLLIFQAAVFVGAGFLLMAGNWKLAFMVLAPALLVIPFGSSGISIRQRLVGCGLIALLYFGVFLWLVDLALVALAVIGPALAAIPLNSDDRPWSDRLGNSVLVLFGFFGFAFSNTFYEMFQFMLPTSIARNKSLGPLPLIIFSVVGIPIGLFIGKLAIHLFERLNDGSPPNDKTE